LLESNALAYFGQKIFATFHPNSRGNNHSPPPPLLTKSNIPISEPSLFHLQILIIISLLSHAHTHSLSLSITLTHAVTVQHKANTVFHKTECFTLFLSHEHTHSLSSFLSFANTQRSLFDLYSSYLTHFLPPLLSLSFSLTHMQTLIHLVLEYGDCKAMAFEDFSVQCCKTFLTSNSKFGAIS
jgi:hypothetical protein